MARPIKETPALTGEDARLFEERMANVGRASSKEARRAYEAFKSISTFPM